MTYPPEVELWLLATAALLSGHVSRDELVAFVRETIRQRVGPPCDSAGCLALATERVFWPVGHGERPPVYCDACAEQAKRILSVLGCAAPSERLPPRATMRRAIAPTGF